MLLAEFAEFQQHWQAAGNEASFVPQPGANHFDAIYGFEDPKSPLCRALFRMMNVAPRSTGRP